MSAADLLAWADAVRTVPPVREHVHHTHGWRCVRPALGAPEGRYWAAYARGRESARYPAALSAEASVHVGLLVRLLAATDWRPQPVAPVLERLRARIEDVRDGTRTVLWGGVPLHSDNLAALLAALPGPTVEMAPLHVPLTVDRSVEPHRPTALGLRLPSGALVLLARTRGEPGIWPRLDEATD